MALIPSLISLWPSCPPTLASLMPPVRGLLVPMETRPEVVTAVPPRRPGARISLFSGPSGSQRGDTSWFKISAERARPPRSAYSAGHSSYVAVSRSIRTRRILVIPDFLLVLDVVRGHARRSSEPVGLSNAQEFAFPWRRLSTERTMGRTPFRRSRLRWDRPR